jgi:aspartyl-tRNA(Asn)/glutamyl-tRNA(Gln) amidotransferase subunit B
VEKAIQVECDRQKEILAGGGSVQQATVLWDEQRQTVRVGRMKEGSDDYRYFPDPDVPPLVVDAGLLDVQRRAMPELPAVRRARLLLDHPDVAPATIRVLTSSRAVADFDEELSRMCGSARSAATWVVGEVMASLRSTGAAIEAFPVGPQRLSDLLRMEAAGTVSRTAARQIFAAMLESPDSADHIALQRGLLQVSDEGSIATWVDAVLRDNPEEASRFLGGERRLQGVLVGLVMRSSGGSADPRLVNAALAARAAAINRS